MSEARRAVGKWLNDDCLGMFRTEDIARLCAEYDELERQIERMKPVVERLKYAESYLEEAVCEPDVQTGVRHAVGLLNDIRSTLREFQKKE